MWVWAGQVAPSGAESGRRGGSDSVQSDIAHSGVTTTGSENTNHNDMDNPGWQSQPFNPMKTFHSEIERKK